MVAMFLMTRWLPEHHQPPLSSRHAHRQLNFYIGVVFVVFMAVGVVALLCCCYHLEWRLRLQARNAARRANRAHATLGPHDNMTTRAGKKIKQETNLSVMMPGDSIPSFLAKAKPHGSPPGAEFSDLPVSELAKGCYIPNSSIAPDSPVEPPGVTFFPVKPGCEDRDPSH